MVKIIVLGHGLIPRNHGIAPKRSPFDADLNLINVIMATGSMTVSIINPVTGAAIPVNANNVNQIYKSMENMKAVEKKEDKHVLKPVVPVVEKPEPVKVQQPVVEEPKPYVEQKQNDNQYKNNKNNNNNKNYNKHDNQYKAELSKAPELPAATTVES